MDPKKRISSPAKHIFNSTQNSKIVTNSIRNGKKNKISENALEQKSNFNNHNKKK